MLLLFFFHENEKIFRRLESRKKKRQTRIKPNRLSIIFFTNLHKLNKKKSYKSQKKILLNLKSAVVIKNVNVFFSLKLSVISKDCLFLFLILNRRVVSLYFFFYIQKEKINIFLLFK